MLGRTYDNEACSAARALEIAGERWSLIILRNAAFAGMSRFSDFQRSLEIAPNILSKRLEFFVKEGLMITSKGESEHLEYRLTPKGADFKPIIIALTEWGDKWAAPDGAPIVFEHNVCGGHVEQHLNCLRCKHTVRVESIYAKRTSVVVKTKASTAKRVQTA